MDVLFASARSYAMFYTNTIVPSDMSATNQPTKSFHYATSELSAQTHTRTTKIYQIYPIHCVP